MTEEQLIFKLRGLKDITPRKDWVLLVKTKILESRVMQENLEEKVSRGTFANVFQVITRPQLSYAFALLLFVAAGFLGITYFVPQNTQPTPDPAALVAVKNDVEIFKAKSQNLAQAMKSNSQDVPLAVEEVKEVAKSLTTAIEKDPGLAKEIALEVNNNKTYLEGGEAEDLKETSDALYKTIDEQMIQDLENTTLTDSQQEALLIIKNLYEQGKYSHALESILLLNMAMQN